jgi:hypothetical protein
MNTSAVGCMMVGSSYVLDGTFNRKAAGEYNGPRDCSLELLALQMNLSHRFAE